jgi:hypothetical protein
MSGKQQGKWKLDRRTFLKATTAGGGGLALLQGKIHHNLQFTIHDSDGDYPNLARLRLAHQNAGLISPEKTYRMMEWEFHNPPQANFQIDVEGAVKAARDAGAETLMFYTQSHWGYALYRSDSAARQPNLDYDLFGMEVALARKYGITSTAYYSLQFNNQCVLAHPDWAWVNEAGEKQMLRWYIPCLDSPYRQYVLNMMDEIFARYEIQELFLDIFGIQFQQFHASGRNPFCFCKFTEDAWNQEHPGDSYREGFQTREGWERRFQWHQDRTLTKMLDEIIAVARQHRPDLLISLNGGPESFPNNIMEKVSFIYAEPLPCPAGIALGSILMRGWGRPCFQAGVFTRYGYAEIYPGSIPRVEVDALIAQNARTFFVGNAPVVGGIDDHGFSKRWFAVAKETWEDVKNVDCLLGPQMEPLLSTAMLYSESTRDELDAQKRPVDFRHSTLGALETLTYAGRPVESLAEFRLTKETLKPFEVLVLPEVEVLPAAHVEVIRDWVHEGGTLVASYKCGLLDEKRQARPNFPLADVFGVDFISEESLYADNEHGKPRSADFTSTYLESAGHPLAKLVSISTVGLPGSFLKLQRNQAEEVMHYRLPLMAENLAQNQWFNWGPPPPGGQTAGTAVAFHKFGKGQSLYIGVPIFWAMQARPFWIREWVPALLWQLTPNPLAELWPVPFSEYVHGTFFYDPSKRFILVQVLNTIELATQGELRPAPRVEIRIDPRRLKVGGARVVWPATKDLPVITEKGKSLVVLENPPRYTALYLRLA